MTTTTQTAAEILNFVTDRQIIAAAEVMQALTPGGDYYCPAHDMGACELAHDVTDSVRIIAAHLGFTSGTGSAVAEVVARAYVAGMADGIDVSDDDDDEWSDRVRGF